MEMGRLTAKLRDAVPVCFLVEGKEIKRYKNIEIPDDLKKLEYQDFKFDVPAHGSITFKIMFELGVLPEEFPQARERKTRQPMPQGAESQATATEATGEAVPQEAQPADALPAETTEAPAQAPEDTQAASEPLDGLAEVATEGEANTAEIIVDEVPSQELMAESENTKATAQPESDASTRKPAPKRKGKKAAAPADSDK